MYEYSDIEYIRDVRECLERSISYLIKENELIKQKANKSEKRIFLLTITVNALVIFSIFMFLWIIVHQSHQKSDANSVISRPQIDAAIKSSQENQSVIWEQRFQQLELKHQQEINSLNQSVSDQFGRRQRRISSLESSNRNIYERLEKYEMVTPVMQADTVGSSSFCTLEPTLVAISGVLFLVLRHLMNS